MVASEVLGISILAVVAFVILVIYLCKCYHDCTVGQNKNGTPTVSDQNLILLQTTDPNRQEPLPYDPYCDDSDFIKKDHNDLDVVAMSVQQFHRKQSYRKSVSEDSSIGRKKAKKYSLLGKSNQEEQHYDKVYDGDCAAPKRNGAIEYDGEGVKSPTTFEAKRRMAELSIQAPVTVHHTIKKNDAHIYAPINKAPQPNPPDSTHQVPTYFRPVTKTSMLNQSYPKPLLQVLPTTIPPNAFPKQAEESKASAPLLDEIDLKIETQIEIEKEVISNTEKKNTLVKNSKLSKTSENIPPNSQVIAPPEENVFFIPDTITSPSTPKKTRRKSKGTLQTMDDFVSETPPKPNKKAKKSNGNNKPTTPKTPKRRKKSVSDAVPVPIVEKEKDDNDEDAFDPTDNWTPKSPVPCRNTKNTPYSGLTSPPLPPRNPNRNNPLVIPLAPTFDTQKTIQARTSQL